MGARNRCVQIRWLYHCDNAGKDNEVAEDEPALLEEVCQSMEKLGKTVGEEARSKDVYQIRPDVFLDRMWQWVQNHQGDDMTNALYMGHEAFYPPHFHEETMKRAEPKSRKRARMSVSSKSES